MPLNADTAQTAVLVIGGIILYRVVELLVNSAYAKLTGNIYISKVDHDRCKAVDQMATKALQEDMAVMRGILLVVAVKVGVDDKDLKRLAE